MTKRYLAIAAVLMLIPAAVAVAWANWLPFAMSGKYSGCGCEPKVAYYANEYFEIGPTSVTGYCTSGASGWQPNGSWQNVDYLMVSGTTESKRQGITSCYYLNLASPAVLDYATFRGPASEPTKYISAWFMAGTTTDIKSGGGISIFNIRNAAATYAASIAIQSLPTITGQSVFAAWYYNNASADGGTSAFTPGRWYNIRMACVERGGGNVDLFEWGVAQERLCTPADMRSFPTANLARAANNIEIGRTAIIGTVTNAGQLSYDNVFIDNAGYKDGN